MDVARMRARRDGKGEAATQSRRGRRVAFGFASLQFKTRIASASDRVGDQEADSGGQPASGNFPGTRVDLRFFYEIEGDKIASLEIVQ
jgi:hypothetical protein